LTDYQTFFAAFVSPESTTEQIKSARKRPRIKKIFVYFRAFPRAFAVKIACPFFRHGKPTRLAQRLLESSEKTNKEIFENG
jgi:hypothetical protein